MPASFDCERSPAALGRWAVLIALVALAIHVPLFLRSPLGPDPVMYDLQAQLVNDGGTLYRDLLEPNLPGAVWMHLGVRSLAGWSSEALRAFDLIWFGLAAWLAGGLVIARRPMATGDSVTGRWLLAAALIGAYSTLSEWCHCQRDVWMLPLVLGALGIRASRCHSIPGTQSGGFGCDFAFSVLEGVLWGAAVWIKPHVVVPAVFVVAATAIAEWRRGTVRRWAISEVAVLTGGVIAGGFGVAWLVHHDAWRPMWTMLTEWNRDYVAASSNRWSWGRWWSVQERLGPWSLVHVAALPMALSGLYNGCAAAKAESNDVRRMLVSALYLGWLVQAACLQHLFDYVHVPGLILGAVVVTQKMLEGSGIEWTPRRSALAAIVCVAPALFVRGEQLVEWRRCLTERTNPALSADLARLPLPDWNSLERVREYLSSQNVADGELTAYHTHLIHLYPMLGVRPSTRFVFTETHLRLFPRRAGEIRDALARSRQKWVVSSLIEAGVDPGVAMDDRDPDNWRRVCPTAGLGCFPFDLPVVFRAGPYLVHAVEGAPGRLETGFFPLAAKAAGL